MKLPEFDKSKLLKNFADDIRQAEFNLEQFLRTVEGLIADSYFKVSATKHRIWDARDYLAAVIKGYLDAYASLVFEKIRKGELQFQELENYCLRGFEYLPGEPHLPRHAEVGFSLKDRAPIIYPMNGNWFSGNKIWGEDEGFSGSYRMDQNGRFFVYPRSRTFTKLLENPWKGMATYAGDELAQELLQRKDTTLVYYESFEKEADSVDELLELGKGVRKLLM